MKINNQTNYRSKRVCMQLNLVGTRYYIAPFDLQDYLHNQAPKHHLMLIPEPTNKFDSEAVAVRDLERGMKTVAYVSHNDLSKLHRLMKMKDLPIIQVKVMGLSYGCNTTLQGFPCEDDKLIKFIDNDEDDEVFSPDRNFEILEKHLPSMAPECKKKIYEFFCYLRDNCRGYVPQRTMTAFSKSIEMDERNARQPPHQTVNIYGPVNQMAMGDGTMNNNY